MSAGLIALGICLGLALLASIMTAAYFLLRRRRREGYSKRVSTARPVSDLYNPAHVIVPFGVHSPEGPRFSSSHPPGSSMRVAYQRPDGSWQFSSPEEHFDPPSLSDIDIEARRRKGRDARTETSSVTHASKDSVEEADIVPPPAYSETDGASGYLKH